MNKKWNWFFTIALLLSFIISEPKQLIFAQTTAAADFTLASMTDRFIDGNVVTSLPPDPSDLAYFTFDSSLNPSSFGEEVTFTLSATGTNPDYPPTGYVNFKDNDVLIAYCENVPLNLTSSSLPLAGQPAICTTTSLSAGTHVITAEFSSIMTSVYADETIFLAEDQVVNEPIQLTIEPTTLSDPILTINYQQMLTAYYPGGDSCEYCIWSYSGELPDGIALDPDTGAFSGTPNYLGTYPFTVYVSDGFDALGSQEFTLNVTRVTTSVSVESAFTMENSTESTTLSATAKHPDPSYSPRPTGKISFSVNGTAVSGCSGTDAKTTNDGGTAYCTSFFPTELSAGSYQIEAKFTPDSDSAELYTSGSGTGTLKVIAENLETPSMSIFISSPTYYGHLFNLRANVRTESGSPIPGMVDFSIDGEPVATCQNVPLDPINEYFCQDVSLLLAVGIHTLSATFTPTDTSTYNSTSGNKSFTVEGGSYLLSGAVFKDSNQDGVMSSGEYGISSWTVNLTTCDGDPVMGTDGKVIGMLVTGYEGFFSFKNVPGGQCLHVTEETQKGWQATTPIQLELTLSKDVYMIYFGNYYPYITVNLEGDLLPDGKVGEVYGPITFTASGGEGPYTFSIRNGNLPTGLDLSSDGVLSGTPTLAGDYFFSVQAEDQGQAIGYDYYSITVNEDITYTVFLPLIGN